jgi:hypothetical protein
MAGSSMKLRSINDLSEDARRTVLYALQKFTRKNRNHSMCWDDNLAAVIELYENGFITIETDGNGLAVRLTQA